MKIEYLTNDFSEEITEWRKCYKLTKECILFHRLYDDQILSIHIENPEIVQFVSNHIRSMKTLGIIPKKYNAIYYGNNIGKYLTKINDYLDWLGKHCKDYFKSTYCNLFDHKNKYAGNEWYFNFDCISVIISIDKNENISAEVVGIALSFDDNGWFNHDIKLEDMKIISWERS